MKNSIFINSQVITGFIISFLLTSFIKNNEGNHVGSLFIKLDDDQYFHVHHWFWVLVLIIILPLTGFYNSNSSKTFNYIIGLLAGYGFSGFFWYSDRFEFVKREI